MRLVLIVNNTYSIYEDRKEMAKLVSETPLDAEHVEELRVNDYKPLEKA